MNRAFKAFVVNKENNHFEKGLRTITENDLSEGDVLVKVSYSSINYKDALGSIPNGKIVLKYPLVLGIDLVGEVVEVNGSSFKVGDKVIATSYDIGVSHFGGFSEYAKLKSEWLVPLPKGLTEREAMIYGTAGFTAAMSVHYLEKSGVSPNRGGVLVTGASGGVGSHAVALLAHLGYNVTASTGNKVIAPYLEVLGAAEIVSREEILGNPEKPLQKPRWSGVVDSVGGKTLSSLLPQINRHGAVALSGLTAGVEIQTTVFPFILRGISLIGIDSAYCEMPLRLEIWRKLASVWKSPNLDEMVYEEITLDQTEDALQQVIEGNIVGRYIIKM